MNSEAILFAEWLAENHYKLVNIEHGVYYWVNEDNEMVNTKYLYKLWLNTNT